MMKTESSDNRKKVLKGNLAINSPSDRRGGGVSVGLSYYNDSVSLIYSVLKPRN